MSGPSAIDVSRLIHIASFFLAVLLAALVYFEYQPRIDTIQYRIDSAEAALRSEEVAAGEAPHLRNERAALAARYASLTDRNAESVFIRDLISDARSRNLTLIGTSLERLPTAPGIGGEDIRLFRKTRATIELRGSYRDLLRAIAGLSTRSVIVAVDPPSLRRDGTAVVATIPIVLYEPSLTTESK